MKKIFLFILFCLSVCSMSAYDFLRAVKDEIPGGYNFWVYTPVDYFYSQEQTPVIIFLHGASLCGRNLNKVRRYGPLDAIVKGRDIDALTIVPQNPGGAWNPKKIMDMLDWVKKNYPCDSNRVYVLGMSLGGYGTMDVCATYPDRIAAGMALCGGCSYKDVSGLGDLPFWIIHGTADRAVPVKQSKVVVDKLARISRNRHPLLPVSASESRLFHQFSLGSHHRVLALLYHSCAEFIHRLTYRIAILAHKYEHSVLRDGNGVHPIMVPLPVYFI